MQHKIAPQLQFLRRLWAHDKTLDGLKVACALGGVLILSLWLEQEHWMISLILGVIASALAETEDRVSGRLMALCITLVCFAVAAFSVQWLFPYPWLFVIGLTVSSFGFVMLGAAGERYATIAVASLILAVYTMLGADQPAIPGEAAWFRPLLLLAGAAWYGVISVIAAALFATRAARQSLAQLFEALGDYLQLKADLLEPVGGRNEDAQRLALAAQNGQVVNALNQAREVLTRWVQDRRPSASGEHHLKWFFLAQDVHERASSSHYPHAAALATAFARSDVLFRVHRLMQFEAQACSRLAQAILSEQAFDYGAEGMRALDEMSAAMDYVQTHTEAAHQPLLESLADLCRNITTIERLLADAGNPDALQATADSSLRDSSPRSLAEAWQRIRLELNPGSARFRHALRLALALAAGYGLLHLFELPQGYWVMLTTLFVCRPGYSDTWRRMSQRVSGTVLGLIFATVFIALFPQALAQLALIVVAGVLFFATRTERYLLATASITVLVLSCFNQLGSSYALIWPRLLDTVLGALLSGLVVAFVLPDWQGRRLPVVMARALRCATAYMREILLQYHQGKRDDLPYRIARRDAHNANANLAAAIAAMLGEPDQHRLAPDQAFRFLCASQSLLGYVSALGAHREQIDNWQHAALTDSVAQHIDRQLEVLANALQHRSAPPAVALAPQLAEQIDTALTGVNPSERRVMRQLSLISRLLPELEAFASVFAEAPAAES
ncbi:YccS family putative transporter [Uliginosibacterium sediminicola]|uniref:YccS family putative transporter n=1 Tax=Uliginosibacterium sediminicola TaxID=2024550 RepID=A0ABU9Z3R4_9RHOO